MSIFKFKKEIYFSAILTLIFFFFLESVAYLIEVVKPEFNISSRSKGVYRIFIYGGSTVAGLPIRQWGFVAQFKFWLRKLHPERTIEIYNFGKPAASSDYVRYSLEKTISHNPDLLIVLCGHNEFLTRKLKSWPEKVVESTPLTRVMNRAWKELQYRFYPPKANNILPEHIQTFDRKSSLFRMKIKNYFNNIHQIVKRAQEHRVPLILLTAPYNLSDWPPVHKRIYKGKYEEKYRLQITQLENLLSQSPKKAATKLEEYINSNPEDPMLNYLLAKANESMGNFEYARKLYLKAKDRDPLPWRVLSEFNQAIRNEAKQSAGVYLVDLEKIFQAYSEHGLIGFKLICDNCHPTPLGNAIIARELIKVVGKLEKFDTKFLSYAKIEDLLEAFLSQKVKLPRRRFLQKEYYFKNAKYSMKTPFFHFKVSRMYLHKAMALDSTDWRIWANLATLAYLENDVQAGQKLLNRARDLHEGTIDFKDLKNVPYLALAIHNARVQIVKIK